MARHLYIHCIKNKEYYLKNILPFWGITVLSTISGPTTRRRWTTERSHNNNAVNQHFVCFIYSFVYSVGFQWFCYCHKEGTKKSYITHKESTNKKERPIGLSFCFGGFGPPYSNRRNGLLDRGGREGPLLRFAIVNVHRTYFTSS